MKPYGYMLVRRQLRRKWLDRRCAEERGIERRLLVIHPSRSNASRQAGEVAKLGASRQGARLAGGNDFPRLTGPCPGTFRAHRLLLLVPGQRPLLAVPMLKERGGFPRLRLWRD